uniref:Ig-like domain-containing protein n=1 Tax=Poecilia formosa TaxID=48698 RepID=A0A087XKB2_POEFO
LNSHLVFSVSQHALGGVVEVNEGAESVLMPCIYSGVIPEDNPFLLWTRSDLSPNSVHLRRENGDDLKNQNQRFRGRTSMNPDALDTGNFSLTLRKPEQDDGGNYSCSISDGVKERTVKQIHLKVKVGQQEVEVTEGSGSVVLPCRTSADLPEGTSVEWTRSEPRSMFIHVFPNTSKHFAQQDRLYRDRTEMSKDFLRTGDVSLTLMYPTHRDDGRYVCTVYRDQDVLRDTVVLKYIKAPLVKVDSGVKFVLLPCRTRVYLPGGARVEWRDGENRTVHVYQKGSDDPEEQNLTSRTRTRMNNDPLKTGDLSLTLKHPKPGDSGIYTCRVRKRVVLVMKRVHLQVKGQ